MSVAAWRPARAALTAAVLPAPWWCQDLVVDPVAEYVELPREYGRPKRRKTLPWSEVRERLEAAEHYWLVTVHPDSRPHAVPVDGIWLDDVWYFGGSHETVWQRNLSTNPHVAVHLEDTMQVVVVEGVAAHQLPDRELARRLSEASERKYGYGTSPDTYTSSGVMALQPRRVIAWTRLTEDTTRFRFD